MSIPKPWILAQSPQDYRQDRREGHESYSLKNQELH